MMEIFFSNDQPPKHIFSNICCICGHSLTENSDSQTEPIMSTRVIVPIYLNNGMEVSGFKHTIDSCSNCFSKYGTVVEWHYHSTQEKRVRCSESPELIIAKGMRSGYYN